MKKQTQQDVIRKTIIKFYKKKADKFSTFDLLAYVQRAIGTEYIMPDTVTKQMRNLRLKKVLDYVCPVKRDKIYFILKKPV